MSRIWMGGPITTTPLFLIYVILCVKNTKSFLLAPMIIDPMILSLSRLTLSISILVLRIIVGMCGWRTESQWSLDNTERMVY